MQLIFFYVKDCMAVSGNISIFFEECATASEKILKETRNSSKIRPLDFEKK